MWQKSNLNYIRSSRPMVMAHRGDSMVFPENSFPAFCQACEMDIDCLETDIHLTKDGEIVLFHDYRLDRVTGAAGKIAHCTLAELKQLDIGEKFMAPDGTFPYRGKGLKIQTLEEVLNTFKDIKFNIDIKSFSIKAPFILAQKLKELKAEDRVMVGSFLQWQVYLFRQLSDVPTSAGPFEIVRFLAYARLNRRLKAPYFALQVPVTAFSGYLPIVTEENIRYAHTNNIAVHVWTINEKEEMIKLLEQGVDGIFTDRPQDLLQVVEELGYPVKNTGQER